MKTKYHVLVVVLLVHRSITPVMGFQEIRYLQSKHSLRRQLHRAVKAEPEKQGNSTTDKLKLSKEAQEFQNTIQAKAKRNLHTPSLIVAQVAPSVRVALSEEFGKEPGSMPCSKLVAALRAIGFDLVLDTNTGADLCICEEGTELLHRINTSMNNTRPIFGKGDPGTNALPMYTSCCPGWMDNVQKMYPELKPYISTTKSPHMLYGAVVKHFSKPLFKKDAKDIYMTSIMPCVHKRRESDQECFQHDGIREVDNVLTTKDVGLLMRLSNIDPFTMTQDDTFDSPFHQEDGTGSGAGQLFGVTGGVMEAAVRSVYELVTGEPLPRLELEAVRGLDGVKSTVVPLHTSDGKGLPVDLRLAVVSGLGNVKDLIKKIKAGEVEYDFIECMACPGGCIAGAGQPRSTKEVVGMRQNTIYELDKTLPIRKSHENPVVSKLYKEYLGGWYGSECAEELLHVNPVYGDTSTDPRCGKGE